MSAAGKTVFLIISEAHRGTVSIILAGYKEDIEKKLFAYNDGMASRFRSIQFDDFTTAQLGQIWDRLVSKTSWHSSVQVRNVVSRRLGRQV